MTGLWDGCLSRTIVAMVSTLVVALELQGRVQAQDIAVGFYDQLCPRAEVIVAQTVREFNSKDPTIVASLVPPLFHDCLVEVKGSCHARHLQFLALSNQVWKPTQACLLQNCSSS